MPHYLFKAIDRVGKVRRGNLEAANETDLEARLGKMKMDLIRASEMDLRRPRLGRLHINRAELIVFCIHMSQLMRAGVPLVGCLTDLRDSVESDRFREVIASLIERIEGGRTLSGAMEEYPNIFDHLFVSLIRAGESSGQLAGVFDSLTRMLKWQDELSKSTRKLFMTPLIVGTVVLAVTIFLMLYLVPQLVDFLQNMGETLPVHTRVLIATSNLMMDYWYLWLLLPSLLYIGIRVLAKTSDRVGYAVDDLKLKIWQLGPIRERIILSRFANFFSMMYAAGIPVLTSLEIAEGIIDNRVIRTALQHAREDIEQGEPISQSFENTGIFPPLVVRMLRIGETTGGLDAALLNVSYFYERDINDAIDRLQSLIQPVMTIFVGFLLGWVMLSVLGPVYNSLSSIQV